MEKNNFDHILKEQKIRKKQKEILYRDILSLVSGKNIQDVKEVLIEARDFVVKQEATIALKSSISELNAVNVPEFCIEE